MARPKKGSKKYWPTLFALMRALCLYYETWKTRLPTDLPPAVNAALLAVSAACDALRLYDQSHPGGIE